MYQYGDVMDEPYLNFTAWLKSQPYMLPVIKTTAISCYILIVDSEPSRWETDIVLHDDMLECLVLQLRKINKSFTRYF